MAIRLLNQQTKPKRQIQAPNRKEGWKQLLRQAIQQAEKAKDPRIEGLKQAFIKDDAERYLRKLGIIHEGDLNREFPQNKV